MIEKSEETVLFFCEESKRKKDERTPKSDDMKPGVAYPTPLKHIRSHEKAVRRL
jgi:hypothetical protein